MFILRMFEQMWIKSVDVWTVNTDVWKQLRDFYLIGW